MLLSEILSPQVDRCCEVTALYHYYEQWLVIKWQFLEHMLESEELDHLLKMTYHPLWGNNLRTWVLVSAKS